MTSAAATYEKNRQWVAEYRRAQTRAAQEIGDIPAVFDPQRRRKAEKSFAFFCETYFPGSFKYPWAECHFAAADRIEAAATTGGMFALAMPRGSGKTTICEWAVLWATLTGRCRYVACIGATAPDALDRLKNVKTELQFNELLQQDWPEVCFPIGCLENSVRRADGQRHHDEPTSIVWSKDEIVYPTVYLKKGEAAAKANGPAATSGCVFKVQGITGSARGLMRLTQAGERIRPELVLLDDPQTRESAKSATQSQDRHATIVGDLAYLEGDQPLTMFVPCTVIYRGDLADRLLDREQSPDFHGQKVPMIGKFPAGLVDDEPKSRAAELWEEYGELRGHSLRQGGDGSEATEFYRANRQQMDDGFEHYWPERPRRGAESPIEHAMIRYFRDQPSFWAECQNDPVVSSEAGGQLTTEQILAKAVEIPAGVVPAGCDTLTAFVDVAEECLFWMVCGWSPDFSGHVVDYGAWPDQKTPYFYKGKLRHKLSAMYPNAGTEGAVYSGLMQLTNTLCGRKWQRQDGITLPIKRLLIDANLGKLTGVCYRVCSDSPHKAVLAPFHGKFVGASSTPWSELSPKRNERFGHHWRYGPSTSNPHLRRVLSDVNFWKTFAHERLGVATGDSGSLTLPVGDHLMLAHHLNAEHRERVVHKTTGREVDEWRERPDRPDNEGLDCLAGCCVAASMEGAALKGTMSEGADHRERRRFKDLNALKRRQKERR